MDTGAQKVNCEEENSPITAVMNGTGNLLIMSLAHYQLSYPEQCTSAVYPATTHKCRTMTWRQTVPVFN